MIVAVLALLVAHVNLLVIRNVVDDPLSLELAGKVVVGTDEADAVVQQVGVDNRVNGNQRHPCFLAGLNDTETSISICGVKDDRIDALSDEVLSQLQLSVGIHLAVAFKNRDVGEIQ